MVLLQTWVQEHRPAGTPANVCALHERQDSRTAAVDTLKKVVRAHLVEADTLDDLDFPITAAEVRASLPTRKRIRSGDLGEILGTEYIREFTNYTVPINRLRHKDDRDTAMRGDDILGFRGNDPIQVLKAEAKSAARLSASTVKKACAALEGHSSRPKASSLGFVLKRLREQGRHAEAKRIQRLMNNQIAERDIEHLVFTLSGNDPLPVLVPHATGKVGRRLTGMVLFDHQQFIANLFDEMHAAAV